VEIVLAVAVVVVLLWFVTAPLRRQPAPVDADGKDEARIAELEARKEAKYREIRDAQMDHAAGKLSDDDFHRVDGELRREAIAILKELDEVQKP
jgi:hypothetical protein